jgi:putative DNA primase/helicase
MSIEIPIQLRIPGIRFVLIERASKKPFEKDWTNKEYFFDNTRLLVHLANNGNYGVQGGALGNVTGKYLIILDFDNVDVQEQVCAKLPKTFTVKTGSGLLHKYFFSDAGESFKIFDEHMNTLADIQSIGKQCIGPGSLHPNGKRYEVIDNTEIATIGYAELKALVMPFDKKPKRPVPDSEKLENSNIPLEYREDSFIAQIKTKVSMDQVMKYVGVDITKNPSNCFMHVSKGGQCLGWNEQTWHCFHCVHPQQDVITLDGVKKISDVKVGDITINANGDRVPIIKVTKHPFKGKMLSIYVNGNNVPLKVTHNHGMYYYKDVICNANYRADQRCICKPECAAKLDKRCALWKDKKSEVQGRVDASVLTTNDALFFPIPKTIIDKDCLDVSQYAKDNRLGPKRKVIDKLPLTKEFLWVMGMYIAEGNSFRGGIKFSLHKDETDYVKRILDCFEKELGLKGSTFNQVTPTGESLLVHICNSDLADVFPILFGKGCENKKVPREILDLPIEKCKSILQGIIDGDGSTRDSSLGQTSKQLMIDTYELALKVGYYPSMGLIKTSANKKQGYMMYPGTKGHGKAKLNNHLISPINRIDSEEYNGDVYDITVDSDHHSFLTPQGIIANCLESGNIFSAIQKFKHCNFKEALEVLAEMGGMTEELKKSRKEFIEKQKKSIDNEKNQVIEQVSHLITGKNKDFNNATELMVAFILRNNHIYTTKDDLKSEMWIYREGIYIPNGRSEIKEIVRSILLENFNVTLLNQVTIKIEADTYIDHDKFFNKEYIYEVPVKNGILNIFTKELSPFSSDKIFFNKLPVEYNPEAKCPQIDKFLADVLATEDNKKLIYELAGFCLLKEYRFEKAFIMVGGGRNGKSKVIEVIKRLIGLDNCCGLQLTSLTPDSFSVGELFGKMVNIASDISSNELKDASTFKSLTGRDPISVKRKFLRDLTFTNYAKMIFACNTLPMVQETHRGFFDRWVLLNFPFTFVPKEEFDRSEDKVNFKIRDEDIINKITTETEMSGFLNAALEGLKRLLDNRIFTYEASVDQVKNDWIRKSNSFAAFCNDHIVQDYAGVITKKDLRRKYSAYCKKYKLISKSDFVIKAVLQDQYGANDSREEIMGTYVHCWEGISFNDSKI